MSRDEKQSPSAEGGEDRARRDGADSDRPVELVKRARRPDLALKIVKTSKALDADGERSGPPPPGVITVGGVNEAKAYVPAMRPAAGSKPKSEPDSQRVRVADPRRAPTERLDPAFLAAIREQYDREESEAAAASKAAASNVVPALTGPSSRGDEGEAKPADASSGVSTRVLTLGILIGVLVAVVPVVMYLKWWSSQSRAPTEATSRPTAPSAAPSVAPLPSVTSLAASPTGSSEPSTPPSAQPSSEPSTQPSTQPSSAIVAPFVSTSTAPAATYPAPSATWVRPKTSATPKASAAPSTSPTVPPELVN